MGGTEDLCFGADVVMFIYEPRANLGIGILVFYAAGVYLRKICEIAFFIGSHVIRQAQKSVGSCLTGVLGIGGQLSGVADTAVQHGIGRGVDRGHIISASRAEGSTILVNTHDVAHQYDVALVRRVIGNCSCTERFSAGHLISHEHVVLKVRLMGRKAGLQLE